MNEGQRAPLYLSWSRHAARLAVDEETIEVGCRYVEVPTDSHELAELALQLVTTEDADPRALLTQLRGLQQWPHAKHPEPHSGVRVAERKLEDIR